MTAKKDPTKAELQARVEKLKAIVDRNDQMNIAIEGERHERILDQIQLMENEEGLPYYRRLFVDLALRSFADETFEGDTEDVRDMMAIFDLLNI